MLVYANHMIFSGEDAERAVSRAVGKWLKEHLGFGLHPDHLKQPKSHRGKGEAKGTRLEIYAAAEQSPELYSWVLTNPDGDVRGRIWNAELGLKISGDVIEFSCVVETSEHSALVSTPVTPSKPRVVSYVTKNIRNSKNAHFDEKFIGASVKEIGKDDHFYHDFLFEAERTDRHYPLVLVSPNRAGKYLVNSSHLQEELVGLAQVVKIVPEFNSGKMEEILGYQWSAQDGAVNVIHIPKPNEYVRSEYFPAGRIKSWGNTQKARVSRLLTWVTNDTNVAQRRNRIRPEDVRQATFRRQIGVEATQRRVSEMKSKELRTELSKALKRIASQNAYFDELVEENSNLEASNSNLLQQLKDADDEIDQKQFLIGQLTNQLGNSQIHKSNGHDVNYLFELFCRKEQPNPEECLKTIEMLFNADCVVLDTAKKSAQGVNTFRNGWRLLEMLKRLVDDYRRVLIKEGDSRARLVFGGSEYAAGESESVMNNKSLRRARTFKYQGADIEMFRHLKIGTAKDSTITMRVHFYWDSHKRKIVIGHCGKHLPISVR